MPTIDELAGRISVLEQIEANRRQRALQAIADGKEARAKALHDAKLAAVQEAADRKQRMLDRETAAASGPILIAVQIGGLGRQALLDDAGVLRVFDGIEGSQDERFIQLRGVKPALLAVANTVGGAGEPGRRAAKAIYATCREAPPRWLDRA